MNFTQEPPELGNQYEDDRVLRSYLRRVFPDGVREDVKDQFKKMGAITAGELFELKMATLDQEPELVRWDAWGSRIDRIEPTDVWDRARELAVDYGLVAAAYEREHGEFSRVHQFALNYLFEPSADTYTCPLAMTDGAAKTLLESGNQTLIDRVLPHLTARDQEEFWTSGQWMTETTGGSDVGKSLTEARREDGEWRLYGRKWFTSAAASDMALTLARPEGNPEGGKGLALFFVRTRDEDGRPRSLRIHRLKDKLGTRKLPTAELSLEGTPAEPVDGLEDGVKKITPMLNITRTWNAVGAIGGMRRGIALARDYARKREAFGATLSEKPLHVDTLAGLQAEFEGAFHLTFRAVELLGRQEAGVMDDRERHLLRSLTPVVKLTTAKQAVTVASEVLESFGGAGYVEDTGLPGLLRNAQVLPIWEGTTNVLSLDFLRTLRRTERLEILRDEMERATADLQHTALIEAADTARTALDEALGWLERTFEEDPDAVEAGARRVAMTVGRAFELAYLSRHAEWALDEEEDRRPAAAARRLRKNGVNRIRDVDPAASAALANDRPRETSSRVNV